YWETIRALAEGRYVTKNNADCVLDGPTQAHLAHHRRDLNRLGAYLVDRYREVIAVGGVPDAFAGESLFHWRTDFAFPWMGGWLRNQSGDAEERNLIAAIPGRDRRRAIVMADHYDTAFMEDRYDKGRGGDGARLAAAGADDNHSATAAMLLAAPIFLELSRAGRLACDIWLIHLTGEEVPADCLGARHLCESLVEGELKARLPDGTQRDLSATRIHGVYLMDMIAHNNDRHRDVFQIAPGTGAQSMHLAEQAHVATEMWNAGTRDWNRRGSRRELGRGTRSAD